MKFGKKPTMGEKMHMATQRGYDSGKPSKGSKPAPKAKIRPSGNPLKGRVGVKMTKDF